MTPSTSTSNTFILLFYLIFTILHVKVIGYNGCYKTSKQGISRCQRCTQECSENRNEMEVTPCTQDNNRSCFCKPGFYCTKGNDYVTHCHKPCVPCGKGTFSSTPSLGACKPHKNCGKLGMMTHQEGTTKQDRQCVNVTTVMPSLSTTTNIITTFPITNTSIPWTGTDKRMTLYSLLGCVEYTFLESNV
ncbi:tumor necrosis factor receptor superfamily member 6B-like [Sinocyclocheilus grahami]|uniref:tumor necrosis factor receptor superfamily member 6B-like n=1 Tax=Sinocyclocheilus grahami TaxID=75366 RepID=UPI0007ACD51E|nr:PREDICTED: tumor necrosis factor receptor superfamily member 6B-like [Sinocyclocheilus grahami]